jgi:hypothetical protein
MFIPGKELPPGQALGCLQCVILKEITELDVVGPPRRDPPTM